jgi:hypothetical protein
MPFVDSVVFPAKIVAGTPFVVEVHVSALAKPEILQGPEFTYPNQVGYNEVGGQKLVTVELWRAARHFTDSGAPVTIVHVPVNALGAGEYNLAYTTTSTREQGGLTAMVTAGSIPEFPQPEVVTGLAPFTVVAGP